eukprot:6205970-Pleurochrysis_carterae.AAC.6
MASLVVDTRRHTARCARFARSLPGHRRRPLRRRHRAHPAAPRAAAASGEPAAMSATRHHTI